MNFFIDNLPIAQARLGGPAMSHREVPTHFFYALRINLTREEFLKTLESAYQTLVADLRMDLALTGGDGEDYEFAAIKWPQLADFIDNAPEHLHGIFDTFLWTDLQKALFDKSPDSELEYVADTFKSIKIDSTITIEANAFHVAPWEHDAKRIAGRMKGGVATQAPGAAIPWRLLDQSFLSVLTCWFNLDSVDMRNKEALWETAQVAATELARQYAHAQVPLAPLLDDLDRHLSDWGPIVTMQIINATSVDWLADEEYEDALRGILRTIFQELSTIAKEASKT